MNDFIELLIVLCGLVILIPFLVLLEWITKKKEKNYNLNNFTVHHPISDYWKGIGHILFAFAWVGLIELLIYVENPTAHRALSLIALPIAAVGFWLIADYKRWKLTVRDNDISYYTLTKSETFTFELITKAEAYKYGTLILYVGDKKIEIKSSFVGYSMLKTRLEQEGIHVAIQYEVKL